MKATKLFFSAALVLCAAACGKINEDSFCPNDGSTVLTSVYATTDATKAVLGDTDATSGKILWQPGDKINLFFDGKGAEFTSTVTAPALESTFTGSLTVVMGAEESATAKPLYGIFPYNAANTVKSTGEVVAALPATQTAVAGSFDPASYVAVGKSDTPSIAFYAAAGGVRFTVSRNDIKTVVFKGKADEPLAGNLTLKIDPDTNIPTLEGISSASAIASITLNAPEGECFTPGEWYYIVAAPASLKSGFEMTLYTANRCATFSTDKPVEISRKTFGSVMNVDVDLEFVEKAWSLPTIVNKAAGALAMEINPVTDKPVLAMVENVGSSRGPLLVYNDIKSAPVTVSEAESQYVALGVDANGKGYVFTQRYAASSANRKGEIFSSTDLATWTKEIDGIARTNGYYGHTIGCIGNEVFMISGADAAADGFIKREAIVTRFDGTSWATGIKFADRGGKMVYFPVFRYFNNEMYVFFTNMTDPTGPAVYKYKGNNTWETVASITAADKEFVSYTYDIREPQDMAFGTDGQIWLGIGTKSAPTAVGAVKIDPEETEDNVLPLDQIPVGNDVATRSASIGISPVDDTTYLVYRDSKQFLNVVRLNPDSWEWDAPEQLTNASAADVSIRFNAAGKAYICCTTAGHVEVFETL